MMVIIIISIQINNLNGFEEDTKRANRKRENANINIPLKAMTLSKTHNPDLRKILSPRSPQPSLTAQRRRRQEARLHEFLLV